MSQAPPSTVEFAADPAAPAGRPRWQLLVAGLLLALAAIVATIQSPYHDAYGYGERSWGDWLTRPLEVNPELRLPRVAGNLNAIAFADDGATGFAVGDGGVILETDDGGLNWRKQRDTQEEKLTGVAISDDGSNGFAIGENGVLLARSSDKPAWRRPDNAPAGTFSWVDLSLTGATLRLVNADGTALRSDDGGSWRVLTSGNGEITAAAFNRESSQVRIAYADGTDEVIDDPAADDASAVANDAKAAAKAAASEAAAAVDAMASEAVAGPDAAADAKKMSFAPDGATGAPTLNKAVYVPDGSSLFIRAGYPEQQQAATSFADQSNALNLKDAIARLGQAPVRTLAFIPGTAIFGGIRHLANGRAELFIGDGVPASIDPPLPNAIGFSLTGKGWAVGDAGRIITIDWTIDDAGRALKPRGETGVPSIRPNKADLTAVAAAPDGEHVWATGSNGTLIATVDGGATWFDQLRRSGPMPAGGYRRFPAPWFYLALGLLGGFIAYARRPLPAESQPGVSAMGSTDAPAATLADDKLQFAPLARGISRYLRNANTQPPLTLAISGEWGSGKSSLMRMVCEDLRAHGNHPVWFNAWHHQDEEQLLAALLAAIRDKALPPWLSLDGLRFRGHLVLLRARRKLLTTLLVVAIASLLTGFLLSNDQNGWDTLGDRLSSFTSGEETKAKSGDPSVKASATTPAETSSTGDQPEEPFEALAKVLGQLAAVLAIGRGVRGAIKAFGANPAVLLTSTIDNFKLRDAAAQVHFRTRFQRQFDDVTEALPHPLVIVIDDLDRCRPETVLQVMESVNFLMTSGKCFVLFGMSTPRVQAALALSFKDIAQVFVEIDPDIPTPATPEERTQAERRNGLIYAGDYLQKLINLDIRVPAREDIAPHLLLTRSRQPETDEQFAAARRWAGLLWPLVLVAAVAGAASWEGSHLFAPVEQAEQAPTPTATSLPTSKPVEVIPGQSGGRDWPMLLLLGGLLAVVAALQYRRRKTDEAVADTDAFSEALRVWTPIIARRTPSPRAIKRFGNRLRYLAMLQQAEDAEPDGGGLLPDWLARRFAANDAGEPPQPPSAKVDVVAEHRIVALGAIHAVFGDRAWRNWLTLPRPPEDASPYGDVDKAITAYTACGWRWPPTSQELDAFERSLKGIRLGGEVAVLDDAGEPPRPASSTAPQPQPQPKGPLRKK